jgi:hypothetical protein
MRFTRWSRVCVPVAAMAAAMAAGCYESDFPLDPAPRLEVEEAWLGTWRCLPFNADADEPPATMRVQRRPDRRYAVTWQEGGQDPDRYEGFASSVHGTRFVNVQAILPTGERGKWVFLKSTLLRPSVLQLQVVDSDALKGVEATPSAVRAAIERQLSKPALTADFCVCVRAKEPSGSPSPR